MKSDTPSIDEADAEALRDAVLSTRSRGPSREAMQHVWDRLAAAGVLGVGAASAAKGAPNDARRGARRTTYFKVGAIVLAIVAGSWVVSRRVWTLGVAPVTSGGTEGLSMTGASTVKVAGATRPPTRHDGTGLTDLTPSTGSRGGAGANEIAPNVETATPTITRSPDVGGTSVNALPTAPAELRGTANPARHGGGGKPTSESPNADSSQEEFVLVQRAQAALASDPDRSLSIANEHARKFPNGELTQERELVAVEALSRLGRTAAADRRAVSLLRRFPRTPYVARIENAIGHSLSPAPGSASSANSDDDPNFHAEPLR